MATKQDTVDVSQLSEKEKRELILSMRRLGGKKESKDKRPVPTTDDELWDWIVERTGYRIPRVAVCEDHTAPFNFVADFFFERESSLLLLSSREAGKTISVAIVHYANAELKPGVESCSFGAIEEQAKNAYKHVKSFIYEKDDKGNKTLKPEIENTLRSETIWNNGSNLKILVGSKSGVNSPHPQKVHADELDLMEEDVWDEAQNMSSSKTVDGTKYIAQDVATSTRKSTKGLMQKIIDEIDKAKKDGYKPPWKLYSHCIFENSQEVPFCRRANKDERESRLKELGKDSCELCECDKIVKGDWPGGVPRTLDSVCKGKFFKSRGWMEHDDVKAKFVKNSPLVWNAQMECRRPMADGLYLPTWSREKYILRGYEPKPEYGYIWQGVDWGGCYDEKTEILTKNGWISVKDMNLEDEFASLDPDSHKVIFQKAVQIHEKNYSGEMHEYKNKNIDLLVTSDHKMFTQRHNTRRNGSEGPWELTRSDCLSNSRRMTKTSQGRADSLNTHFILPGTIAKKHGGHGKTIWVEPIDIDAEDWAAFMGLWMAEGHTTTGGNGRVGITHLDKGNLEEIRNILTKYFKVNTVFHEGKEKQLIINDARLYQHLLPLGKCYEKYLPNYIKQWDKKLLEIYFDWHSRGDGNRNRIYTTSKRLADDLQEIAMYAGWAASIAIRQPRESVIAGRKIFGRHPEHIVGIQKTRNKPTIWSRNEFTKEGFKVENMKVYCPSLPKYHTVYVRRNNKAVWCGNSEASFVVWIQGPLHQPLQVNNSIGTSTILPQGSYIVFDELTEASMGATRLADKVVRKEIYYKNRYGSGWRVKARFADKAGRQQREDWREHNPPLRTHWYLSGSYFDPTVECVQAIVADNLLFIDDQNAPGLCDDLESWRQKDGREVHDQSSHGPAALRYCLKNTQTIVKRYKKESRGLNIAPIVVGREGGGNNLPGAVSSGVDSSLYSSEKWRESLGGGPENGQNGGREPWQIP